MSSEYKRDGRAPVPVKEVTSKIMRSIRGKDTKPELLFRAALFRVGVRGYRIHSKKIVGCPDVAFLGRKIAIFVHGCFWHRCPSCSLSLPKSHSEFWKIKFEKNIARDKRNEYSLVTTGWKVVTIWECQITNDAEYFARKVKGLIQ